VAAINKSDPFAANSTYCLRIASPQNKRKENSHSLPALFLLQKLRKLKTQLTTTTTSFQTETYETQLLLLLLAGNCREIPLA